MTDRKPDIITKWSIKKNERNTNFEGEWVATCTAYPNIIICGDDPDRVQFAIKDALKKIYTATNYVDGGITGYTVEVGVYLVRDHTLDYFSTNVGSKDTEDTKDTADPVKAQLLDIGKQLLESEEGLQALDNGGVTVRIGEMPTDDSTPEPATDAPELHEEPCIKPLAVPKKPRAKRQKKPEPTMDGEYEWKPIKDLVAGCALCDRIATGECVGNYAGEFCGNYKCRSDAGSQCSECNKNMKVWNEEAGKYNKPFCTVHKADISNDDFCCYAFECGRFKE